MWAMPPRSALFWLLVLAGTVAAVAGISGRGSGTPGEAASGASLEARVVRVVDGDTVKVATPSGTDTVRYIGIDTPESVKPNTPVQCFAKAASHRNAQLVAGQPVRLVVGVEPRDRYGRLLAYVYRRTDGRFVNAALVAEGYARTLTFPPNDRFAQRFGALAATARAAGRGLWGACAG